MFEPCSQADSRSATSTFGRHLLEGRVAGVWNFSGRKFEGLELMAGLRYNPVRRLNMESRNTVTQH